MTSNLFLFDICCSFHPTTQGLLQKKYADYQRSVSLCADLDKRIRFWWCALGVGSVCLFFYVETAFHFIV